MSWPNATTTITSASVSPRVRTASSSRILFGWNTGSPDKGGYVCCWDENRWGKSTAGFVTIVLNCDDVQKTYEEIRARGFDIDPPRTADWGGMELTFKDPDGNTVMIL